MFDTKFRSNYAFASEEDIKNVCVSIDHKDEKLIDGGGGVVALSNGEVSYTIKGDTSNITIGASGSKKSRNVVMPHIISSAKSGSSIVIHDPKGDLFRNTSSILIRHGYNIRILNYRNPMSGNKYNLLRFPCLLYKKGEKDRAREMFNSFANTLYTAVKDNDDPFWTKTAAGYFSGLAELLALEFDVSECTVENIYNLHMQGNEKCGSETYLKTYFKYHSEEVCYKLIYPFLTAPSDTKNSLISVFTSAILPYIQNESVVDQSSTSDFEIEDIIREKTALFIISRDEGSVYDPLISAVIDQVYAISVDVAESNGGCLSRRLFFILDEFGNLAPLTDIEKKLTLSRARRINWHIVVQSLEQLSLLYGEKRAKIIIGNCNNIIYLYSPDLELIKYVSNLCGNREGYNDEVSIPLCSINMLRQLNKDNGETLLLIERSKPFITHLIDISEYYEYMPLKEIYLESRSKKDLSVIDFRKIVEEDMERQTQKILEDVEEKKKKLEKEFEENKDKLFDNNHSLLKIVYKVIEEIKGEDDGD